MGGDGSDFEDGIGGESDGFLVVLVEGLRGPGLKKSCEVGNAEGLAFKGGDDGGLGGHD